MMRGSRVRTALGLTVSLLTGAAALARAQEARPSAELQARMTGRFALAEPRPSVEARLSGVVEQAVAPMSFLIRPIARSRLGRVAVFCAEYRLALDAERVSVICDARPAIERRLDGSGGKVSVDGGEPVDVAVAVAADRVALTFKSSEGQRTTTYRLDSSGGLEVAVQVTSGQLEKPLEWAIRYQRRPGESAP
jgi:hypothetical protein